MFESTAVAAIFGGSKGVATPLILLELEKCDTDPLMFFSFRLHAYSLPTICLLPSTNNGMRLGFHEVFAPLPSQKY